MSTQVILDVEAGLTPEETADLRQLLYDALGEFVSQRSGRDGGFDTIESALAYVSKRYPELGAAARMRKANYVMQRKVLARKLHLAASNVRVKDGPSVEMIETIFVAGIRAAETGADLNTSPYPDGSVQNHWWTRGFAYQARQLRAIEAEMALKARDLVVPIRERVCEVLPTYFPQSIEDESRILGEVIRDGKRDEASPLTAYAKPRDERPIPDVTIAISKLDDDE